MLPIYCYTDYRSFLQDAYSLAKETTAAFSYRYFARKAGFSSPNFLKLVIDGKRNLSQDSIPKFTKVFKLGRRERRFFETLVYFNQAGNPEEQAHYYQQLLEFPEYCRAQELAKEQYAYLSRWYYPVVRELVALPDFSEDPEWIARKLERQITPAQARDALEGLCRLRLLVRNDDGLLTQDEPLLTTGDGARMAAAFDYHQQMMDRAKRALHTQTSERREYGALTIALNQKQLKMLKKTIRDFRKVVMNLISQPDEEPDSIYQLNIQLFAHSNDQGSNGGKQ